MDNFTKGHYTPGFIWLLNCGLSLTIEHLCQLNWALHSFLKMKSPKDYEFYLLYRIQEKPLLLVISEKHVKP